MPELTTAQINKLLAFRGYGNPNGRFWFVGMEEGGSSEVTSLQIRADNFDSLADLAESHSHFPAHDMSKLSTSTWRLMSAIAGRISGASDWRETEFARQYQRNRLGRLDDETYLTEILPLPKSEISDWPYEKLFESPKAYFELTFPNQLASLRAEYRTAKPKPQFVFCYGKTYWNYHRTVFDFIDFRPAMNERIMWGRNDDTIFVLTSFFNSRAGVSLDFVNDLATFVTANSPSN